MKKSVRILAFLALHAIPSVLFIAFFATIININTDFSEMSTNILIFIFTNQFLTFCILNMIIMPFSHRLLHYDKTKLYCLKLLSTLVGTSIYSYLLFIIMGRLIYATLYMLG